MILIDFKCRLNRGLPPDNFLTTLLYCALKMRLHELLMDMITEHNYGVPIPLSHDDHSSHMDDIHTEMEKRLIVFLALPGILIFIRLKRS